MPHCFVLQPNGMYAIWSSITDTFLEFNLSPEQAVQHELASDHGDYPGGEAALKADLESEFEHIKQSGRAWDWSPDWNSAVRLLESRKDRDTIAEIDDVALPRRMKLTISSLKAEKYWKEYWMERAIRLDFEVSALRYRMGENK